MSIVKTMSNTFFQGGEKNFSVGFAAL